MRPSTRRRRGQPPTPPSTPTSPLAAPTATAPPLLTLRMLVLLTASVLVGLGAAALTWLSTRGVAPAVLAGLSAAFVTLDRLHQWTAA